MHQLRAAPVPALLPSHISWFSGCSRGSLDVFGAAISRHLPCSASLLWAPALSFFSPRRLCPSVCCPSTSRVGTSREPKDEVERPHSCHGAGCPCACPTALRLLSTHRPASGPPGHARRESVAAPAPDHWRGMLLAYISLYNPKEKKGQNQADQISY